MISRALPWLIAIVCIVAGGALWRYRSARVHAATRDPREIVRKAWSDGRRVPLEGRQIVRMETATGQVLTLEARVLNSSDGKVRIEYLTEPLAGVTIWENGDRTYRFNPRLRRIAVSGKRGSPDEEAEQELQLLENYSARIAGEARIAGRPTVIVDLRPRQGSGPWRRIWVDTETWVILASEDRRDDRVYRSTRFVQLRYFQPGEEPPASAFRPDPELLRRYGAAHAGDTASRFTPERLSRLVGFRIRTPSWLPRGYTFRGAYPVPCSRGAGHRAVRLEYSDGLNTISLFECGHQGCAARAEPLPAGQGDPPIVVKYQSGDTHFVAVGDVPREDLQRMVRSAAP